MDFFEKYGADVSVSSPETQRKSRSCRVVSKVSTDDQEKHNTLYQLIQQKSGCNKAMWEGNYVRPDNIYGM